MDARRLINTPALHKNIYKQLKTNNVDYLFSLFFKPRDVFTFIRINIPARCPSLTSPSKLSLTSTCMIKEKPFHKSHISIRLPPPKVNYSNFSRCRGFLISGYCRYFHRYDSRSPFLKNKIWSCHFFTPVINSCVLASTRDTPQDEVNPNFHFIKISIPWNNFPLDEINWSSRLFNIEKSQPSYPVYNVNREDVNVQLTRLIGVSWAL